MKVCNVEDCKANMEHRKGVHSNWCPNLAIENIYNLNIKDFDKKVISLNKINLIRIIYFAYRYMKQHRK